MAPIAILPDCEVGIPMFGPSPVAAQMEGSKTFSKHFMARHKIPTAEYQSFTPDQVAECVAFIDKLGGAQAVVLKASGLAGGKGVLLPETNEEAKQGVDDILVKKVFGEHAGTSLVIEERLDGPELSVLAFSDGYTIKALPGCQDHKRIGEGDTGPNTGGMGAYCPAPEGVPFEKEIYDTVLKPTIDGMRADGLPFVGCLFVGLMLTSRGPKVLEYNVRFGDPETEAVLDLLETPLADIILACVERRLDTVDIKLKSGSAVSIILASKGYPGKYPTGLPITLPAPSELPKGVQIYHAGTKLVDGKVLTAGGRVLAVSGVGATLQDALKAAYAGVDLVQFEGKTFRRDIAHRALKESSSQKLEQEALTYASAGVSIDAGDALVQAIKPLAKSTVRPGCDADLGGFGGSFDLKPLGFNDPILVSGTDGVGTKLRVALDANKHDTVGVDLVAMSVNDLLVQGALPLYFLDYFACSKLDVKVASAVISGVAEGCRQAESGLIGGETAEMPGMYEGGDYDLAGFAVGAVERTNLLPQTSQMQEGDVLIGLPSSGLHSNGYSLVRKVVTRSGLSYAAPVPWQKSPTEAQLPPTLGEALLIPTQIYVKSLAPVLRSPEGLLGMSHITGGGFTENIPRALPKHLGAHIDLAAWERPGVFPWLQKVGNVDPHEMARTFNNGIGMVLIVRKDQQDRILSVLKSGPNHASPVIMGQLVKGTGVSYSGLDTWRV